MTELRFTIEARVAPEVVLGALLDFTDRRTDLWPELDPKVYRVERVGETTALLREGQRTPRLWALEEYDWSVPGTVKWTARESNFCAPGSYMSACVEPGGDGGSRVHCTWSRTGIGGKGKLIVAMMRITRGKPYAATLGKAIAGLADKDVRAA